MRKLPLCLFALLIVISCSRKSGNKVMFEPGGQNDEVIMEEESGVEEIKASGIPYAKNIGRYDEVFNDSNYIQYQSAESLGINPIYELRDAYNTSRPLIKIENGRNYQIDNLTHSMPYLVPEAASLLDEIGEKFSKIVENRGGDSENNKIIVTSVLRSPHTVRKLRRVNRNAVDSSTHMFGTTFDIAWNNFYYPDSSKSINAGVLKGILAEVLLEERNQGKCYVKYEKKTPCFHITVRTK